MLGSADAKYVRGTDALDKLAADLTFIFLGGRVSPEQLARTHRTRRFDCLQHLSVANLTPHGHAWMIPGDFVCRVELSAAVAPTTAAKSAQPANCGDASRRIAIART